MRLVWALSILLSMTWTVFAAEKPLPRGLEALGIPVSVSLDMSAADLNKINGEITKNGRFVSITTANGYIISMTLNAGAGRVVKVVAQIRKDLYSPILKKMQEYSEGNQSETEILKHQAIHTWRDGKTVIRLVSTEDFSRIDVMNAKELEE